MKRQKGVVVLIVAVVVVVVVCVCVVKESSLPAEGAPRLAIDDDAVFCVEVLYLPLEASSFSSFSSSACHAHASRVSSSLSPDPVGRY